MVSTSGGVHFYHDTKESNWARFNKIMCDYFHRGTPVPPRVKSSDNIEWQGYPEP